MPLVGRREAPHRDGGLEGPRLVSETARRHGITRSRLMAWRRAPKVERVAPEPAPSFVPAVVVPEPKPISPAMLLDARLQRREFDLLVDADDIRRQVDRQCQTAIGTAGRAMIDDGVAIFAQDALVTVVAGLRAAGTRPETPRLAVRRGRLGARARCLRRPLKLQHQVDQLGLAQPFEIVISHARIECASDPRCKRRFDTSTLPHCPPIPPEPPGSLPYERHLLDKPIYDSPIPLVTSTLRREHNVSRSSTSRGHLAPAGSRGR